MFQWFLDLFGAGSPSSIAQEEDKRKQIQTPVITIPPIPVPIVMDGVELKPGIPEAKKTGYDFMKSFLGCHEVKDRKKLMEFFKKYAKNGDIYHDPSNTAWCAIMVNACERAVGNPGTPPKSKGWYSTQARSFENYGVEIAPESAKKGDIVVFSRGGSTRQGHVAYFESFETHNGVRCVKTLGGNQGDSVSYSYYPVGRLLAIRRSVKK